MISPRIALTTTSDRGATLAQVVVDRGCQPVLLPCIEVVPATREIRDEARARARAADWILVTSSRAISTLWPDGDMPDVAVAAVGQRTADSVAAAGGSVEVAGDAGAADLVSQLGRRLAGKRVVFPHAAAADESTPAALRDLGADVTAMAVYQTRPLAPGPDVVDAALFGSPSAVTGWSLSRDFDQLTVAAIGPTTAAALEACGHPADIVPERPDFHLMIDLVARHLTDRSPV